MVKCGSCNIEFNGKFCPQCGKKAGVICNSCEKGIEGKVYDLDGEPHCQKCYNEIESTISVAVNRAEQIYGKPKQYSTVVSSAKFCSECGTKSTPGTKFCASCGNKF